MLITSGFIIICCFKTIHPNFAGRFIAMTIMECCLSTDEENSDVLPRLDAYKTGPMDARRPSWLTDDLVSKIRGNKIRIHSAVWTNDMRSLGHLEGVTDVDLAEAKGQSTSVVDKCYRGMKAAERKSSTQLRWTLLMEDEGEEENRAAGRAYLTQGEIPSTTNDGAGCSHWSVDDEPPAPKKPKTGKGETPSTTDDGAGCPTWWSVDDLAPAHNKLRTGKVPKTGRRLWSPAELELVRQFAADPANGRAHVPAFVAKHLPQRSPGATWLKIKELRCL